MMGDRRDVALDWLLIDGSRPGEDSDMGASDDLHKE